MITGKNYIGNQQSSKGSKTYKTFNPQLNIENEQVHVEATPEEINKAVTLAANAYKTFRITAGDTVVSFTGEPFGLLPGGYAPPFPVRGSKVSGKGSYADVSEHRTAHRKLCRGYRQCSNCNG